MPIAFGHVPNYNPEPATGCCVLKRWTLYHNSSLLGEGFVAGVYGVYQKMGKLQIRRFRGGGIMRMVRGMRRLGS